MNQSHWRIRAHISRQVVGRLHELPAEAARRVRDALSEEQVARARGDGLAAWVDMVDHMTVCNVVQDVIGSEAHIAYWEEGARQTYGGGFLQKFFSTAKNVFGASPMATFKRFDWVYSFSTRNLGTVEVVTPDEHTAEVTLDGFPADRFRFSCYREGTQGSLRGIFALFDIAGEVTVVDEDEGRGRVVYRARW